MEERGQYTAHNLSSSKSSDRDPKDRVDLVALVKDLAEVDEDDDYLIRSDGSKVKVSSLKGKDVIFVFRSYFRHEYNYRDIVYSYNKLASKGCMEVVFVSLSSFYDKDEESFFFESNIRWPAIPFNDCCSRNKLFNKLSPIYAEYVIIFDKDGYRLKLSLAMYFKSYGPEIYLDPEMLKHQGPINVIDMLKSASNVGEDDDYLIRSDGSKAKMSNLKGKNLVFLFHRKTQDVRYEYNIGYTYIAEAYEELSPKGHLEVVFVSTTNRYDKEEEDFFFKSKVPWTAIPFSDFNARKQLRNKLSPSGHDLIFDTNGNIFLDSAVAHHFELYGAELFPFTNEHLSRLREYFKAENAITLHSLFKDAPLMSPDLEQVSLSKLNGKIVGVYMFAMDNFNLKNRLLEIYYHCKPEFEVVLMDFHSNKFYYKNNLSFTEGIKGLPWFSFPFRDFRCRRIWHRLNSFRSFWKENILTIFDKKGRMVETIGYPIVEIFGTNAFPFTQERVIEIEKQRLEEVTLETLFNHDLISATVIRHTPQCLCKVVTLKEYMKRRKSLFFLCADRDGYNWIKGDIAKWYCTSMRAWLKKRETNPGAYPDWNFEVIFVFDGDCKEGYDALIAKMPWAAIPFEKTKDIVDRLKQSMLYVNGWSFITFTTEGGGGGKLISVDALKNLDYYGSDDAPVRDDGRFLEEVKEVVKKRLFDLMEAYG